MSRTIAFVVAWLFALLVSAPASAIIGGERVVGSKWSGCVALAIEQPDGTGLIYASGTLIAPNVVLTAAHCVDGIDPRQIRVHVGNGKDGAVVTAQHRIKRAVLHPQYRLESWRAPAGGILPDANDTFDFAYLELERPITDPTVEIIPPLTTNAELNLIRAQGLSVTIVGFGLRDAADNSERWGFKNELVLPTQALIGETEISFSGTAKQCSHSGDSGGPAYVKLPNGQWRVAGVCSRGRASDGTTIYGLVPFTAGWVQWDSGASLGIGSQDLRIDHEIANDKLKHGSWLRRRGEFDSATRLLKSILEVTPNNPEAHYELSLSLLHLHPFQLDRYISRKDGYNFIVLPPAASVAESRFHASRAKELDPVQYAHAPFLVEAVAKLSSTLRDERDNYGIHYSVLARSLLMHDDIEVDQRLGEDLSILCRRVHRVASGLAPASGGIASVSSRRAQGVVPKTESDKLWNNPTGAATIPHDMLLELAGGGDLDWKGLEPSKLLKEALLSNSFDVNFCGLDESVTKEAFDYEASRRTRLHRLLSESPDATDLIHLDDFIDLGLGDADLSTVACSTLLSSALSATVVDLRTVRLLLASGSIPDGPAKTTIANIVQVAETKFIANITVQPTPPVLALINNDSASSEQKVRAIELLEEFGLTRQGAKMGLTDGLLRYGIHSDVFAPEFIRADWLSPRTTRLGGDTEIAAALLRCGATVDCDVMACAIEYEATLNRTKWDEEFGKLIVNAPMVSLMLSQGGDANAMLKPWAHGLDHRRDWAFSPLGLAIYHSAPGVVNALIAAGADVNRVCDPTGLRPLKVVRRWLHEPIESDVTEDELFKTAALKEIESALLAAQAVE